MTILVTGAAGFIGSHVCQVLLDRGERILSYGQRRPREPISEHEPQAARRALNRSYLPTPI